MWDRQILSDHDPVIIKQNIQIQGSRSPMDFPRSPSMTFDLMQSI